MKTVKILATLAILAGGAANAVTVNFATASNTTGVNTAPPDPASTSTNPAVANAAYYSLTHTGTPTGSVTTRGFYWQATGNDANTWKLGAVNFATSSNTGSGGIHAGTGVGVTGGGDTGRMVSSGNSEFILLDFGNSVQVTSLTLYLSYVNQPYYFSYAWLNSAPAAGNTTPSPVATGSPTLSVQLPFLYWDTSQGYANPTPGSFSFATNYTFDFSTYGTGRYLMIGSSDLTGDLLSPQLDSAFRVNSVTYTSVPDGAATLALLGAAFGALGLAFRRRES